jgi:hypothetical protein
MSGSRVVYFVCGTFSDYVASDDRMINEQDGYERKRSWSDIRYDRGIYL